MKDWEAWILRFQGSEGSAGIDSRVSSFGYTADVQKIIKEFGWLAIMGHLSQKETQETQKVTDTEETEGAS